MVRKSQKKGRKTYKKASNEPAKHFNKYKTLPNELRKKNYSQRCPKKVSRRPCRYAKRILKIISVGEVWG